MKIFLTYLTLLCVFSASSQKIDVSNSTQNFSSGSHNAYSTVIYGISKEDVETKWKSFLKDFKNEKVKSDNGEIFGDNLVINDWGNNPIDIYSKLDEDKKANSVVLHVAFDLGGAYLSSSDADKHNRAIKMLKEFAAKTSKDGLNDKMKEQEKIFAKLENEQKDLERENKNAQSNIESYREKIKKGEEEIKKNEEAQLKKRAELEIQKNNVNAAKLLLNKLN